MKTWLKKRNKKLLKTITDKTYDVSKFHRDKRTLHNMYVSNGMDVDGKGFHHYVDAVEKVFKTRKAERYLELSKWDRMGLKFEKNIYYITKAIENVLTRKERKISRKKQIIQINDDLDALREKYRVANHIIKDVKVKLIREYENGLDGLKK